jgi:pimeloyl-ACP methyl ester carboxylesterase
MPERDKNIKHINIDGMNIEYWTKGEGKPVLFLHGSLASFRFYLPILEILAKKYQVYAPSFPGMGKSDSPKGNDYFESYIQVALEFINKIIGKREFILAGHSLGATVAFFLNREYSLNILQLIILNPGGKRNDLRFSRTFKGLSDLIRIHLKNIRKIKFNQIIPWDIVNMSFFRISNSRKILKVMNTLKIGQQKTPSGKMPEVIIFTAEDDSFVLPSRTEYIYSLIPDSKMIYIKQGGHVWFIYDNTQLIEVFK